MSLVREVVMAVLILPFPEEQKTGSQVKAVRVLFIAGAPHPFSRLASAFMYCLLRYQCW